MTALAVSAVLCAVLAGLTALYVQLQFLAPNDGAAGQTLGAIITDPFVLIIWLPVVAVGACVGFVVSVAYLWNVKLTRALPCVVLLTVAGAAAVAPVHVLLSPVVAFIAGLTAMMLCRLHPRWRREALAPSGAPTVDHQVSAAGRREP